MITTKGHYRLILADVGAFTDETEAFAALDAGNRERIKQVVEKDNTITDYAYYGFTGFTPYIVPSYGNQYYLSAAINAFQELSIGSGTYNPSYDYRKAKTYADAGITELACIQSPTISNNVSALTRTLTGTFAAPVSDITINSVCSVFRYNVDLYTTANFPASILWLTTPVTQTTTTTLFVQYTITFSFSSDSSGYNTLANSYLQSYMNTYMADPNTNALNQGFIMSPGYLPNPATVTGMTPLKPAQNKLNVRHPQKNILYMTSRVPNTQEPRYSDYARWRVGGAVSYGASPASNTYAHSRTNITYHQTSYPAANNVMLGYSDIGNNFVHTDVMKHSVSESNVYPQLDALPPPTSVATVDMTTTATSVDFPRALDIVISKSGEANAIPDSSTAQAYIKYLMPDYNISVDPTFIPVQNFPDATAPAYNKTYVKNTILDMFTVGEYVYYLYNNASSGSTANSYLCKWLKNSIESGEGVVNVGNCYSGVVVGSEIWLGTTSGLAIFNTTTGTITSILTTTNGLLSNNCIYVDVVGSSIYVYHADSITILSTSKSVTSTISTATLNPSGVIPFICGIPKVLDNVIIWGQVFSQNNYTGYFGNSSSPATIQIYNPSLGATASVSVSGTGYDGIWRKPKVINSWKTSSTTIRIYILLGLGNWTTNEYLTIDYNMTTGVATTSSVSQYTASNYIYYPTGGYTSYTGVAGVIAGIVDSGSSMTIYSRRSDVSIITHVSKTDSSLSFEYYNFGNSFSEAEWTIGGTDVAFMAGNQKMTSYLCGSNPVVLNSESTFALTMYVDPTTGALSGSPVVFDVSTVSYTHLPDNFTITFSNTNGFSAAAQLIAGERFTMVYMNGAIKKNSQSATYYSYLYLGTLLHHTATITVAGDATYVIPEAATVNFRAMIDDQTVITSGATTLLPVVTITGDDQYIAGLDGTITFSTNLIGASVNITYYTTNRNG